MIQQNNSISYRRLPGIKLHVPVYCESSKINGGVKYSVIMDTNRPIVRLTLIFYSTMFISSLLWVLLSDISFSFSFNDSYTFLMSCVFTLLIVGGTIYYSIYTKSKFQWAAMLEESIYKVLGHLEKNTIIVLALLSAVGEEFFFRGALQAEIGYVFASIIFGSIHFIPQKVFLPWTIFALVMGFVLGWLYMYSENLLFPIITHGAINYINLMRICNKKHEFSDTSPL